MKLELNKSEVTTVVNIRSWREAFGRLHPLMVIVFLGPVIFGVCLIGILIGWDEPVASIFACIGVLITAYIPTVVKKFKKSKKEIINEVVKEERGK